MKPYAQLNEEYQAHIKFLPKAKQIKWDMESRVPERAAVPQDVEQREFWNRERG